MQQAPKRDAVAGSSHRTARTVAVLYAVLGAACAVGGGIALALVFGESWGVERAEIGAGVAFVLVSGGVVYLLLWRFERRAAHARAEYASEQRRYSALFHEHPDSVYLFDREGHFVEGNRSLGRLLEVAPEALIGQRFDRFVAPEERARVRREFMAALAGQARTYQADGMLASGRRITVQVTNIPLYDEGGVSGVFGIAKDVTAQRKAQRALEASETRFRSIVTATDDAIVVATAEGDILDVNPAAERLFGFSAQELKGRNRREFLDQESPAVRVFYSERDRKGTARAELSIRRADGSRVPVDITANLFEDEMGRPCAVVIIRDISARKAADRQLTESEERFRTVLDQTGHVVYQYDLERTRGVWAGACAALFGHTAEELAGMSPEARLELVDPADRDVLKSAGARARSVGGPYQVEYRVRRRWGVRHLRERGVVDRERNRIFAVISDIGAEVALSAELRAAEARLREVVAHTGQVVTERDLLTGRVYYDGACEELYGLSAHALQAMTEAERLKLIHPDDVARWEAIARPLRDSGGQVDIRYRVLRPDGQIRRVRSRCVGLPERHRTYAIIEDETREAELLDQLRASEERFRNIIKYTGQVVYEVDLDTDRAIWGGSCKEIMGLEVAELNSLDFEGRIRAVHEADREAVRKGLRPGGGSGGPFSLRFRWLRPDDASLRQLTARGVYLPALRRVYGIIEDVTESVQLLETLQQREQELAENAAVRQAILDALPAYVVLVDADGLIRFANAAWRQLGAANGGAAGAYDVGTNYFAVCAAATGAREEETRAATSGIREVIADERRAFAMEYTCHSEAGQRWFRMAVTPCTIGGRPGAVIAHVNISDQIRAEAQLRLVATAFERADEAILICDREFRIQDVNRAYARISALAREQALGRVPSFLEIGEQGRIVRRTLADEGFFAGELMQRRENGEIYTSRASITAVTDSGGAVEHYVVNFSDISAERELELELDYLAWHDALTGLPNRAALEEWFRALPRETEGLTPVALAFVDLDRFKIINESMGHAAGDELLKEVGRRLRRNCEPRDYVARPGGDEFLVALRGVSDANVAETRLAHLLGAVGAPFAYEGHAIYPSASAGICLAPRDGETLDVLLRKVEVALAAAKEAGRGRSQGYLPAMEETVEELGYIEHELRNALRKDELILHYQPEVRLSDGLVTGLEALVRWESPVLGLVPPGKFIPVAEETGLIVDIGAWVLREACRSIQRWRETDLRTGPLSVNLSAAQFLHADLIPLFRDTIRRYDVPTGGLRIEVTESVAMLDPERTVQALGDLRALGIEVAVDDFGTGYSSLAYLRRFPVQYIKLDRAFVRGLPEDETNASIVASVLDLARDLGMKVIAEGVETTAERDALRAAGCGEAQGYFFSPPLSGDDIPPLLRGHSTLPVEEADGG